MQTISVEIKTTTYIAKVAASHIRNPTESIHAQEENGKLVILCPIALLSDVLTRSKRFIKSLDK